MAPESLAATIASDARLWQSLIAQQDEFVAGLLSRLLSSSSSSSSTSASSFSPELNSHVALGGASDDSDRESSFDLMNDLEVARKASDALKTYSESLEQRIEELEKERDDAIKVVEDQDQLITELRMLVAEPPVQERSRSPLVVPGGFPESQLGPESPDGTSADLSEQPMDTSTRTRSDDNAPPFVLVLYDVNSAPFSDGLISQGKSGGLQAAKQISWQVERDMHAFELKLDDNGGGGESPQILTCAYYDKAALLAMLHKARVITSSATWEEFAVAFNSSPLCSLSDIGSNSIENKIGNLLTILGSTNSLKRVYVIGTHPEALIEGFPAVCFGDDSPVLAKTVLVNFLDETDGADEFERYHWRTAAFQHFFSKRSTDTSCWQRHATNEEEDDEYADDMLDPEVDITDHGWSLTRVKSTASRGDATTNWRRHSPAIKQSAVGDARSSSRKINTNRGFLNQDPQICVFHYLSANGCTSSTCIRAHDYALSAAQLRRLREDVAIHPCKELRLTGRCTWAQTSGGGKCMYSHDKARWKKYS